jgi:hypothetical protein
MALDLLQIQYINFWRDVTFLTLDVELAYQINFKVSYRCVILILP